MACKVNSNALLPLLEHLIDDGESSLSDLLKTLYDEAMLLERERYLQAESTMSLNFLLCHEIFYFDFFRHNKALATRKSLIEFYPC